MKKQKLIELVNKRLLTEVGHRVYAGEPEYKRADRQWRVPLLCPAGLGRDWKGEAIPVGVAVLDADLSFVAFPTREQVATALATAKTCAYPGSDCSGNKAPRDPAAPGLERSQS